jgi:glycosyltransferase involved in cell wall biosynthesis
MKACVIIATKNRKESLRRAITSVVMQRTPVELLVIDDGSTDGTSEMVEAEFSHVRLERTPISRGYIAQRNCAALMSSADVIISIDDDATFSSPWVVEQTITAFGHPRVAAVAIPYIEPHKGKRIFQSSPDRQIWITDMFRGTAYAVRREIFIRLGGYREQLVHQGEELDFCIRLLDHGFVVRLGSGDYVVHDEMPERDWNRMDFYGRRNDILFVWNNVPAPFFLSHLIGTTLRGAGLAATAGKMGMARGILAGYRDSARSANVRAPVSLAAYRLHRALKKGGPRPLADIESLLPPYASNLGLPAPPCEGNMRFDEPLMGHTVE